MKIDKRKSESRCAIRLSLLLTLVFAFSCTERRIRLLQEEVEADRAAGRIEEAIDHYREILALDPTNLDARNDLGFLHASESRPDSALLHYALAILTDSTIADPHYNSGVLFVAMGQADSARAAYERAVRHEPNHVQALSNLGTLLEHRGLINHALGHYNRATVIDSAFLPAWVNTGRAHLLMGNTNEAVIAYQRALSLEANQPGTHAALATIYLRSDDLDKAIFHLEQATQLAPDSPAKDSLHEALARRKDRERRRAAGEMRARHIVVHKEGFALMLLKRVRAGENFATIAREVSIDPSATTGGDIGAFQPGDLVPVFEKTVLELDQNEIGGPIQTPLGWHIIQRIY